MRRHIPLLLPLAVPLLCAAMVRVDRPVPALIQFEGAPPVVGLVEVHVPDDVMQRAPSDFANMSGMIAAAADKALNRDGSGIAFKDLTGLGYKEAQIERAALQTSPVPFVVKGLPGLPVGVDTPLVTVVEVVGWSMGTKKSADGKQSFPEARVALVMSTWTKDGATEVDTQYVVADVVGPGPGSFGSTDVTTAPGFGLAMGAGAKFETLETKWFLMADGRKVTDAPPKERDGLFQAAVADAVGVYFVPFTPHVLGDAVDVRPGKTGKDALDKAKGGDVAGATSLFEQLAAADGADEVAAFDAAMLHYAQGDTTGAIDWMNKSIAVKSSPLAQGELGQFQHEIDVRKTIHLAP